MLLNVLKLAHLMKCLKVNMPEQLCLANFKFLTHLCIQFASLKPFGHEWM